ncbi:RidA family protein [Pedobacter caeni]|uniref:Enamine deaminase RidA, house cleaning of reactive enamine intermediates, YjgF/YER057c/UK114 family n=1 Tax=Pedobacter caeni TaxID=288992 RepID=A0A1M4VCQ9_9SPHI|nr:RidA family protein [Pedobacter caeni]SHE66703.1 Enamine deaminase RidA, house cleaning of reactive enamine intermediates, YjgF/YER057c/UK114 family [Pedobacter caeni]
MTKTTLLFGLVSLLYIQTGCKNSDDSKKAGGKPATEKKAIIKEKWNWGNEKKQDETAGYAQVVKVGNTLYISGVPTSDLSPKGITALYKTLEKCLNAYGASSENVVKENLYTTDIELMKKYNDSRKEFYKGDYPAATWVQISRLYEAKAKVEVDLIAQLPDNNE